MNLKEAINKRILVLDGAMGTMIQSENQDENSFRGDEFKDHNIAVKGMNDLLNITQPEIIKKIHCKYLDAGADIITTNTFNANYFSLKDYGLENYVDIINRRAVEIAKEATNKYNLENPDKHRFVAGSIGPTGKTASLPPQINNPAYRDVSFDTLVEIYSQQANVIIEAGVDILLVETIFDTLNAKAALYAINEILTAKNAAIPVMVSVTIDESGRNLSGQTIEAFYNSLYSFSLFSVGLNCSFGADKMSPCLERLSEKSQLYISAHPNAGLPNEMGDYEQSAQEMATLIENFCKKGLINIVGGCCGSRPEHIKAIAESVFNYPPRKRSVNQRATHLSGLQSLDIKENTKLVKIGEKANVAGSRLFARLIKEGNYEKALEIAADQVRDGALILDVNLDESMIDAKTVVVDFLNCFTAEPDVANVPVMLDSSDFEVIFAGLKCLQGRSLVNSINLKDGEEDFKLKALKIKKLGAVPVVMAFDEKGQADTYKRKIEICKRAYNILTKQLHFQPEDIVFDPNVLTIGTGIEDHNNYAVDFIKSVKWIKENLPYAKVNAGVSNVSFSFRGNNYLRDIINSVFLYHCVKQGLDFAIVNPSKIIDYKEIPAEYLQPVEDLVLNKYIDATEKLLEIAGQMTREEQQISKELWREKSPEERIMHSLIHGITNYLETDITELKKKYKSGIEVIQGPLMDGMNKVGELFGEGKMFLPQIIKSARIMNKAVDMLKDNIKEQKTKSTASKTKILLATVEGDVHDIGKNIVALVLGSNNFEVIDMGVMVPNSEVLKAIEKEHPDIVGLSGLISPSLDKMIDLVKMLAEKNYNIPVLLGGAATSAIHTAIRIAPNYDGVVVHVPDATKGITVANQILGNNADAVKNEIKEEQKNIRVKYLEKKSANSILSLDEARKKRFKFRDTQKIEKPNLLGIKEFDEFKLKELREHIDWSPFFHGWGLKGIYPAILKKERVGEEAEKLFEEANRMLDNFEKNKMINPRGIIGIFPANSRGDDLLIYEDDNREKVIMTLSMLRQQQIKKEQGYSLSLADYIAPAGLGIKDYFGGFAVTTGLGTEKYLEEYKENGDSYDSIMFRLLSDRLVEAAAELMHLWVRKKYWGYNPDEDLSLTDLIKGNFKGIRPAVGYPACPDHSLKSDLFRLLNVQERIGITLTDIYAMNPASSVSGFYFANSEAKYFGIGKIGKDQIIDYAKRRGQDVELTEKLLYFAIDNKKELKT